MKPSYDITPAILKAVISISQKIGAVEERHLVKQNPKLRKRNRIKTIQSSLAIEGNTLSEAQITALLENKRVLGPARDIQEAQNALAVYESLPKLKPTSQKDFLGTHKALMSGLVPNPGRWRTQGVGIVKGSQVAHVAPPADKVLPLMQDLLAYLKEGEGSVLITSCVFHYEVEFIHPFMDGNGRMGRLWQMLILMQEYPLFQFLPFETLIAENGADYYKALSQSDKEGRSTKFIEYLLPLIDHSLAELLQNSAKKLDSAQRLDLFLENTVSSFTRKEYLQYHPTLSGATGSRDLRAGVEKGLLTMQGDKKTATYKKVTNLSQEIKS